MKFFRVNRKVGLKQKEAQLLAKMRNFKLSAQELLGKYKLPATYENFKSFKTWEK